MVTWSSKKQNIVTLSSTEEEYVALTHAVKEVLWLWTLFQEFNGQENEMLTINCDNQGSIALSKDNKFHAHTKHINVRYHFIHECVADGKIELSYVPTNDNVLDVFTKVLLKLKFQQFVKILGLKEIRDEHRLRDSSNGCTSLEGVLREYK